MNLISANQSQQDFSTQQRIFQPSQTWFHSFIRLSCKLFRLSKAIWSVVNARSKQATRRHHLDRQTRSGSRQYTPTQKNTHFRSHLQSDFASRYCQLLLHDPLLAPVPFPTKLWVRCWQGRWLPGFYFTKKRQSSQLSRQFVNISVCRWHGEE